MTLESLNESTDDSIEKLKKWALNHGNDLEKGLAELGYPPIPRGGHNSFLGSGVHNSVYEVNYNGKRAAARMSMSKFENAALKEFMSLKDRVPDEYKVHFPVVYEYVDVITPAKKHWTGAILEFLQPLNVHLDFAMGPARDKKLAIAKRHEINTIADKNSTVNRKIFESSYFETLGDSEKDMKEKAKKLYEYIRSTAVSVITEDMTGEEFYSELFKNLDLSAYPRPMFRFAEECIGNITAYLTDYTVPHSLTNLKLFKTKKTFDAAIKSHPDTKAQKLYEFLNYLHDEMGISWEDVHTGNFMVRPNTGDYVIVDPGKFQF